MLAFVVATTGPTPLEAVLPDVGAPGSLLVIALVGLVILGAGLVAMAVNRRQ